MAGETFLTDVSEGLDTMIAAARTTREYPANVMLKQIDRRTLTVGTGTAWREFLSNPLTAQDVGENDIIDNPQQLDGSILTISPTLVAIHTAVGDRVALRLNPKAFATFGRSNQMAIDRKKDQDCLLIFASAGTELAGTGTTLTSGNIAAAVERIASDPQEPWDGPICAVLHGYGLHDIRSEAIGGVGSYPIPEGYTADAWKNGVTGLAINGAELFRDGLITVDATPDARGGIFAKGEGGAIVLVQGKNPWRVEEYKVNVGYGQLNVYLKDEYAIGERSSGNWLYAVLHDATVPS